MHKVRKLASTNDWNICVISDKPSIIPHVDLLFRENLFIRKEADPLGSTMLQGVYQKIHSTQPTWPSWSPSGAAISSTGNSCSGEGMDCLLNCELPDLHVFCQAVDRGAHIVWDSAMELL